MDTSEIPRSATGVPKNASLLVVAFCDFRDGFRRSAGCIMSSAAQETTCMPVRSEGSSSHSKMRDRACYPRPVCQRGLLGNIFRNS
jgi:hypothetical protein